MGALISGWRTVQHVCPLMLIFRVWCIRNPVLVYMESVSATAGALERTDFLLCVWCIRSSGSVLYTKGLRIYTRGLRIYTKPRAPKRLCAKP